MMVIIPHVVQICTISMPPAIPNGSQAEALAMALEGLGMVLLQGVYFLAWNILEQQLAYIGSYWHWLKKIPTNISGWWFGPFFIFPYIGNNPPN